jgi:hypothetical protein
VNEVHESSARDHVSLQMENELLALEVRFLRARLKSIEREVGSELQQRFTELSAEHRRVLGDMRWMLRRMNESPAGPMLRRLGGFRALLERYPQPPT